MQVRELDQELVEIMKGLVNIPWRPIPMPATPVMLIPSIEEPN
jgi:hypothetical protein